jgi:hypothetical protein
MFKSSLALQGEREGVEAMELSSLKIELSLLEMVQSKT